jgi:hypothetical protein
MRAVGAIGVLSPGFAFDPARMRDVAAFVLWGSMERSRFLPGVGCLSATFTIVAVVSASLDRRIVQYSTSQL